MTRSAPAASSARASSSERIPPEAWSRRAPQPPRPRRTSSGRDAAGAGAVQVDEVDAARAGGREAARELDRVAGPLDDVVVVSLVQAHGALAEHVDGRDHLDRRRRATMMTPC